jgi:hypothetical protein
MAETPRKLKLSTDENVVDVFWHVFECSTIVVVDEEGVGSCSCVAANKCVAEPRKKVAKRCQRRTVVIGAVPPKIGVIFHGPACRRRKFGVVFDNDEFWVQDVEKRLGKVEIIAVQIDAQNIYV